MDDCVNRDVNLMNYKDQLQKEEKERQSLLERKDEKKLEKT